jgi:hypothetical protein
MGRPEHQAWYALADQVSRGLESADIILLFVSPSFFESDYCFETEMREALRRHAAGTATVIPIIIRPCAWHVAPFAQLQALPQDGKPISTWTNIDEACLDVAEGVMRAVSAINTTRAAALSARSHSRRSSRICSSGRSKPVRSHLPVRRRRTGRIE